MSVAQSIRESGVPATDYYAPNYRVEIDGHELDPASKGDVLDLKVNLSIEDIDGFELTINNWDDRHFTLKYSDDTETFDLCKEVHVQVGYADRLLTVFRGIITAIAPRFPESGPPTMRITAQDKLTSLKNSQPDQGDAKKYENKQDWEIAREVAQRNSLAFHQSDRQTGPVHTEVWQRNQDDATFLMERAARIDFDCYIRTDPDSGAETLYFERPLDGRDSGATRVYVFEWQKSLIDFTPEINISDQVARLTVRGWDPATKSVFSYTAEAADLNPPQQGDGSSGPEFASRSLSRRSEQVLDAPVRSEAEARELAIALLRERAYEFVTGSGKVIGLPDLRPGDNVELNNLGRRFSGTYYVKAVEHTLGSSGYMTSFQVRKAYDGNVQAGGPG